MGKSLSEMTLEELWTLFPIVLSAHRSRWAGWYEAERQALAALLHEQAPRIHHIGSTAIRGIRAKPIVDILVELPEAVSMEDVKVLLTRRGGYICMSEEASRMSFNKGYTASGFAGRVFHLHLRRYGDNDELYFRDLMNESPELAGAYEQLKLSLWKKYEHDRDAYTRAKGPFVERYTRRARAAFGGRY